MAALDGELPPLGSAEFEALLMEPLGSVPAPFDLLGAQASTEWMLEDTTASGVPTPSMMQPQFVVPQLVPTGMPPSSALPGMAPLPDMFLDPFLASLPDFAAMPAVPLPSLGADTFVPPPMQASSGDLSGEGSGATGGGRAGAGAGATSAAARGPRGGAKKELTEAQKERIKAKNRRAQNRYREKQKAKAVAAEAEFNDTAAQLQRMRLENAQLQEQQAAMQKVLEVREQAMALLQAGKAEEDAELAAAMGGAEASCSCPSPDLCTCGKPSTPGGGDAKASLVCEALAVRDSGERRVAAGGRAGGCPLTGLSLSQIAELKKTPPEVLKQNWKSITQRLEAVLQQQDAAANSADPTLRARTEQLQEQLKSILVEGQAFCFEHAVYQPTNVQKLFAASLDDGRSETAPDDMAHWQRVAGLLELSPAQLSRLAAARAKFLQRIGEVCAERRAIFERLQGVHVATSLRAMQEATASWLEVHEATAELTANMGEEHCVCMGFVRDAFGYVLSPQQKARAAVASYPFFPDSYSIATAALQASGALGPGDDRRLLAGPAAVRTHGSAAVAVAAS